MSQFEAAALGALAGLTIFIGLPVARLRGLSKPTQGLLNALATGILVFLLWDILAHAAAPVDSALQRAHQQGLGGFALLAAIFAIGVGAGLLVLVYSNAWLLRWARRDESGAGATAPTAPAPQTLAMMIATGLGLHNFSEGLAIGQSAASGAIAFAGVLVVGFALHNITEGFGIAAPMSMSPAPVPWRVIGLTGLIGGGPTFLGTMLGYVVKSEPVYVLFLAVAAGALLYVLNELFAVCRRLASPRVVAWGVLIGLLAAYATDLFLTYAGS
ncbi:MAG TPA: ZIP family metal transporter [Candidatus Dormibacteraeota bacterium]